MNAPSAAPVRAIGAGEAEARLDELAAVLVDAVDHGASVNFLAGLTVADGRAFWRRQVPGFAAGAKRLFVADNGQRIVGTVMLSFAPQPNAPHRGEIGKMLVHSSARRLGLGNRLLAAAEAAAWAAGRTLLLLDTETGSPAERLYRSRGWTRVGTVPGHSLTPHGRLADATFFFKVLEAGRSDAGSDRPA